MEKKFSETLESSKTEAGLELTETACVPILADLLQNTVLKPPLITISSLRNVNIEQLLIHYILSSLMNVVQHYLSYEDMKSQQSSEILHSLTMRASCKF